ncbi:unnamed protein product [Auanema sp. JU1783]|nr:unnamed protein product [Auanema sp. JU1783]
MWLLASCLLLVGSYAADSSGKAVTVTLNAKWGSTALIAETSEFVAQESNKTFWDFVQLISEKTETQNWESLTQEKKYDLALKKAATVLGESSMDILRLSLSLRSFSPIVQLFQQIGSEYKNISCSAFFDVHGKVGCSAGDLIKAVEDAGSKRPELLSVDHIFPSSHDSKVVTIVYGDVGSPEWRELHRQARTLVKDGKTQYVLRHYNNAENLEKVSLSGYGVELAIKNTEYKAEDDSNKKTVEDVDEENLHGFNFKLLKELHPDAKDSLQNFRMHLKEIEELAPLKQWEIQDVAFQAAQKIIREDPDLAVTTLKELSQNFPLHARTLSREAVDSKTRKEIERNQKESFAEIGIDAGETALFLNGINMDLDNLDMFQLVDALKQEERLASGFFNMGFRREYLSILVGLDLSDEKVNYAIDYRESYPFYLNNLDTDSQYKQWGNSVKLMLQPYYPGMIRPIARNLFTLVFVVNPAEKESRNLLRIALSFYQHEIPLRIGVVFAVNNEKDVSGKDDAGVAILNLFNFLTVDSSVKDALRTINKLLDQYRTRPTISVEDIKSWFESNYSDADFEEVFGPNTDYDKGRSVGAEFLENTAIGKAPQVLLNGFPLDQTGIKGDKFEETVMLEVMKITPKIQRAVQKGQLTDRVNVGNWLVDQKDVMPRLNKRILDAPSTKNYLDLTDVSPCKAKTLVQFNTLTSNEKSQCLVEKSKYLSKSDDEATLANTLWLISLLMNPSDIDKACASDSISSLIHAAYRLLPLNQAKQLITKLTKEEFVSDIVSGKKTIEDIAVGGMNVANFQKEKKLLSCDKIKMEQKFAISVLGLKPGDRAVVANGLIIGPLNEDEKLTSADFGLLEKLLGARGSTVIASHVDKWEVDKANGKASDVVLRSAALIGKHSVAKKRTWVVLEGDEFSSVTLVADDPKRATMDVVAIVDPLSRSSQKLAPILEVLRKSINCDLKIVMNPKPKLSELPLKRFYRYVVSSELQFDHNGNIAPSQARFTNLPSKQLLTLSVHSPEAWMIENIYAQYDLDNIKMEQVTDSVNAIFSLEHILLEGHCFDEVSGAPPRGLQFVLGTASDPSQFDTIVMANLGYFQLKANPGSWQLRLRDGRSKDIYDVSSHTNTEGEIDGAISVLIDSFTGRVIRLRVSKKEGMEERNLLSDENEEGGIWNTLSSSLVGEKHETINVFSLASGHLYERFMRIMILSVMKNTKHPVKFWLLKNYLSPQFKDTLPIMADHYGFKYELVEYKWPRWLHQQKEKHRIMWGYKILFLDVLFPLDVQKVIFVDADQVVRADLMELMELDLGGAPYGYAPFCESRKEMDGYRFWKQGYWANHLAGRKYHISALYVIDLHKFRQIAAGDRLRGQYQGLSSDPNSLSNLDQDLPNNMIHQVKIKSLPQEWLWCETWCDNSSKKNAKTIDLCNNPQTKEPKLDSASRIIPEWKDYDQEIKDVISQGASVKKPKDDAHQEL